MKTGEVLYAKKDDTFVLKYIGDVRYTICPSLNQLINDLYDYDGYSDVLVDLTEVVGIDSTNLGILARIANLMNERFSKRARLISTNEDVNRTLDTVGFFDVFLVDDHSEISRVDLGPLPRKKASERDVGISVLQAHRILSELNEGNREAFRSVIEGLELELGEDSKEDVDE